MEEEVSKDSMVILMRHAITNANIEKRKYKVDDEVIDHEGYKSIKVNKDLRDVEIWEEGIKQWEKLGELMKDIKVHYIHSIEYFKNVIN